MALVRNRRPSFVADGTMGTVVVAGFSFERVRPTLLLLLLVSEGFCSAANENGLDLAGVRSPLFSIIAFTPIQRSSLVMYNSKPFCFVINEADKR